MSAGQPWVDRVMMPLTQQVGTPTYNRLYEAVSRGTEEQGEALIEAIRRELERATTGEPIDG